ncbi:hypothetical protein ACSTJQ_12735 [Vibrio parahaemolyticus]
MELQKLFEIAKSQARTPSLPSEYCDYSQEEKHLIRSLCVQYCIENISFNGVLVDTNDI